LVALKLSQRDGGAYRNTPETDLFLDRAKPSHIGGVRNRRRLRLQK
jgi:hypothetical protein